MIKLSELINENISELSAKANRDVAICDIHINAGDSNLNSVLFYNLDTNKNIELLKERLAKAKYAACFVNYNDSRLSQVENLYYVPKEKWLETQKSFLEKLYPVMWKNLKIIGVTGTNGKTTSVHLINQLLNQLGREVISVGTLGVMKNLKIVQNLHSTSPSYIDNWKILSAASKKDCVIAFEVSSHALVQQRFYHIPFDVAFWTSFSQDHLDYHQNLEDYFKAKLSIINLLNENGKLLICKECLDITERLPINSKTELVAIKTFSKVPAFFEPKFNKINLTLVLAALEKIGVSVAESMLQHLTPPPGRFNVIACQSNLVIIDYAHTPDAIENITKAIRDAYKEKKLITIFGCGGDRDRTKRPLMGSAAALVSDEVIVTSDNPRSERPMDIINEILPGLGKSTKYQVVEDRANAITETIQNNQNSVILIAGKGHEDYMDIAGTKIPYSDEAVVRELIK